MMVYINYLSSIYRLKEVEKTIKMLGGESESPEMVRAQRDFIKLEKEYFGDECVKMNLLLMMILMVSVFAFVIWRKYYV